MSDSRIEDVPIRIPEQLIGGVFANAFRVIPDTDSDVFLDFCSYSESDQKGVLVARVRVHVSFLKAIRDRLGSTLSEITQNKTLLEGILVRGPGEGSPS